MKKIALAALILGCGGADPQGPVVFNVRYELVPQGPFAMDSVKYDDGTGAFITVTPVANDWFVTLTVPSGGTVAAQAWGVANGPGTLLFNVSWTVSGVSSDADTVRFAPVSPQSFSISIPRRTLFN